VKTKIVVATFALTAVATYTAIKRAQMWAREMGAMSTMSSIQTAEARYFDQFKKYAGSMEDFGPPPGADLLPRGLALDAQGSGYRYSVSLTAQGYAIHANPIRFGTTGHRTFFSDESLSVHHRYGPEPATASDPMVK
jgi:Tfp pilus assembly protein PilE